MRMRRLQFIAASALAALAGCNSEDGRVHLVPVTGTVTLNGKPMAEAFVSFVPDPGNKELTPGNDATGPEGNYKIMWKNRSGVAPGKYKVVITPPLEKPTGALAAAFKDDPYMADLMSGGLSAPDSKKKSPLTKSEFEDVVVGPEGDTLDFDAKGRGTSHGKK
jgi:hypothetical protein